jgi:adenylate cyclase
METVNRKLTTVLSADVQGFSRLMEADEERTFATLKTYRDAMARLISTHGGRIVNTWGDGIIAEFPSVVSAVRAAVDVQNELASSNEGRPDNARMYFRIGINLGDVIVDGSDIYGDGVNIAARLQSEAQPGGILISNTVYDQVRNKMPVAFEFLGNLSVKNIDESIPSYAVRIGEVPRGRAGADTAEQVRPAETDDAVSIGYWRISRKLATLSVIVAGLTVLNLVTSPSVFWARWPILAIVAAASFNWARSTQKFDRIFASLGVTALTIVAINLFSWHGEFWAIWPLLVLAVFATFRWVTRRK